MRLIDADALEKSCKEVIAEEWNKRTSPVSWADAYEEFLDEVERTPTVDIKTEVAKEIFAEIGKLTCTNAEDYRVFEELKNKYTKEGAGE